MRLDIDPSANRLFSENMAAKQFYDKTRQLFGSDETLIITVASDAGRVGSLGESIYSGAKGGVISFSKSLAREMARYSINVNCISPGNTATPLNQHLQDDPEFVKLLEGLTPTGRAYLTTDEIAGAALFLASDDASAFHGAELVVDDGWNA